LLAGRTARASAEKLTRVGLIAEAEVVSVFASDDAIVTFKFLLPDGKSTLVCTYPLAIRYARSLRPGDRIAVRYNPKCPAINRLEPDGLASVSQGATNAERVHH
jgi:hypothetical protein